MRAHLGLAAALPCAPLLLWQGRRVRRDTPKLPEAEGPRDGIAGADRPGRPLRLLIVGDSSAAGVGARAQDEALAGRLVARLAPRLARPLAWRLVARTGATTRDALALIDAEPPDRFDVAGVALGVNQVTAVRPVPRWQPDVSRGHGPMHRFPALPQPRRGVMGLHARALDAALGRWCAARPSGALPRATHVPLPAMRDPALVASDGFHPGPGAYAIWAEALAPHVAGRHR
ncbi:MAG TPA: SGNH/GDSL hydrolase family protein [Burkholderiaceae bacterium]|nr:SGNH/GDSL hydrolase family protein [Burkholderiaceae bacterium]